MIYVIVGTAVALALLVWWYVRAKRIASQRQAATARRRSRLTADWQKVLDRNNADRVAQGR